MKFIGRLWTCSLVAILCAAFTAQAQSWTNRYNGPANGDDTADAVIVIDPGDNAYVTGMSSDNEGNLDNVTIKYAPSGAALWTNTYIGTGNGEFSVSYLARDAGSNIYLATGSYGTNGYGDLAVVAYSSGGAGLWTNRFHGVGFDDNYATGLTVAANGIIYVTGATEGTVQYDYNYVTLAYSNNGVALWTNYYSGPSTNFDFSSAIATDAASDVFVTGASIGTTGHYQYATVAYTAAGAPLWTNRYVGPAATSDEATAIAVSGTNVYVTGTSSGLGSGFDLATVAYSTAGTPLWTNRYNGAANNNDEAVAVAADAQGNVFVGGQSMNGSNWDFVAIKYTSAGAALWTNRYDSGGQDYLYGMTLDRNGSVYLTGESMISNANYSTVAYTGAGVQFLTQTYNGPDNGADSAQAIAVDVAGNIFVTGTSYSNAGGNDYLTIRYAYPLNIITNDGQFRFSGGHFGFDVTGPLAWPAVVETSSNLLNWTPVVTNTSGGAFYFSDPQTNVSASRFYKAALLP